MKGRGSSRTMGKVIAVILGLALVGSLVALPMAALAKGGSAAGEGVKRPARPRNWSQIQERFQIRQSQQSGGLMAPGSLGSTATTAHAKRMHRARYALVGTVNSVAAGDSVFTVKVKKASGAAKPFRGQLLNIAVTASTKFVGAKDLSGIFRDGRVSVVGTVVDGTFVARLVRFSPRKFVLNGVVTALGDGFFILHVNQATRSIKQLVSTEAIVYYNEKTKFVSSESTVGVTSLTVNAQVNVAGWLDGPDLWARRVVIKPLLHLEGPGSNETTGSSPGTTPAPTTETVSSDSSITTGSGNSGDTTTTGETTPSPSPVTSILEGIMNQLSWVQSVIASIVAQLSSLIES
jgi:hypothetical protein